MGVIKFKLGLLLAAIAVGQAYGLSTTCNKNCVKSQNYWAPRAFSSYARHDLETNHKSCIDSDHHFNFSAVTEYMSNFCGKTRSNCSGNLGSVPFWSGTNTMTIGRNDGKADLDAWQLGLGNIEVDEATGIGGIIQLNPKVQHVGSDLILRYAYDVTDAGFICKVHAPLVAMSVDPRFKELEVAKPDGLLSLTQETVDGTEISYHFKEYPTPLARQQSISEAFMGGAASGDILLGNASKIIALSKGRIAGGKQTVIRLADLSASVGYRPFVREHGFLDVMFKVSCPTGNVGSADYMLEPIAGRGGNWGVGAEMFGLFKAWENIDTLKKVTIRVQGEVLHLSPGRRPTLRSFDLKQNGPGSKYLLVQYYSQVYDEPTPDTAGVASAVMKPQGILPAIDLTTLPVFSTYAAEGSLALMVQFDCKNWDFAVGGEFWGRAQEKLKIDGINAADLRYQNLNDFAVLGRQQSSYSVDGSTSPSVSAGQVDTYACEPLAQIGLSQNPAILESVAAVPTPLTSPQDVYTDLIKDARIATNRIPEKLSDALDIAGAQAPRVYSGSVFAHAGYCWKEHEHQPSLKLVAAGEFSNQNTVARYWSVGLIGSLNF